jgi:hypothetical protein
LAPPQYNQQAQANTRANDPAALRKRVDELAAADRCDEALRAYDELKRLYTPPQRAPSSISIVRCLRQANRLQDAEDEMNSLNNLRAAPRNVNEQVNAEAPSMPTPVVAERRAAPAHSSKKSKKAAPPAAASQPAAVDAAESKKAY